MARLRNCRHEIFAVEMASGAPLLTSYLRAGYKDSYSARFNASRLYNTPKIRERINELMDESKERSFVHLAWIQAQLVKIVEGKNHSFERIGADGKPCIEIDRMGALIALAKTIGGFAGPLDGILAKKLSQLTDDELRLVEERLTSATIAVTPAAGDCDLDLGRRLDAAIARAEFCAADGAPASALSGACESGDSGPSIQQNSAPAPALPMRF